jgi:hypothetical protein
MSEKQKQHFENQPGSRPEVSPDQKKAFTQTYTKLFRFLQSSAEPTMAVQADDGQSAAEYMTIREADIFKKDFRSNSMGGEIHIGEKAGWAYANTEQAPVTIQELALIAFCDPADQSEQDVFVFGKDSNVEHFHYGDFSGLEVDDEGEEYPDSYETRHVKWLNTEEIEALGQQIEDLEPGWIDIPVQ